jgi:hypothetical protein
MAVNSRAILLAVNRVLRLMVAVMASGLFCKNKALI